MAPRVGYLFTSGRKSRLDGAEEFPSEMFYGYVELQRMGWPVDLIEEPEVGLRSLPTPLRRLGHLCAMAAEIDPVRVAGYARPAMLERLNRFDAIVATNQQFGFHLAVLRALRLLRARVVTIAMGVLPRTGAALRVGAIRALARFTTIATISRGEQAFLRRRLGASVDVRYLPFGVDHAFWRPGEPSATPYVLSVGNDRSRDFDLLARVWRPEWPRLRIITRRPVSAARDNVEVVSGDYRERVMTDVELRRHVQGAMCAVVPVVETVQPSGQSAALQAMACGIPVVMSDIEGLWDRDVMRDGVTCLLARPESETALAAAVLRVLDSPDLRAALGRAARAAVEQHFTADLMATQVAALVEEACSTS